MFSENKLIILKNIFNDTKFQEDFLENIENLEGIKDIVVIYEDKAPDERTKFFKALQKCAKCQEFNYLQPALLKKWAVGEFDKNKVIEVFQKLEFNSLINRLDALCQN